MTTALLSRMMDNPMAAIPTASAAPVPEEIHQCPGCGAVWEKWEEYASWQHDSGFVRYTSMDPAAEKCCPVCAARAASRETIIGFCELMQIEAPVMADALCKDGEGQLEDAYIASLWAMVKRIAPEDDFWANALDYIGEYHGSQFYDFRKEYGV
nr:hypothetical protein [Clostridia bacterium]